MEATFECLACFMRQAVRASRVATEDPELQRRILDDLAQRLPGMDLDKSPASLSQVVYELTMAHTGVADPYAEQRRQQNEMALGYEAEMRNLVKSKPDSLEAALHLSAAGNVIDLGTLTAEEIDLRGAVDQIMKESFAVDHTVAFRESLDGCNDLLFLLDNAGEIVFDKILIEELQKHTAVTAVVKAGPIINDALREDAVAVGLTEVCEVIDNGGAFVGAPLDLAPPSFIVRMEQADMIVGKGQGNYETIDAFDGDVFLILRAKCEVVAAHMGVQFGQMGLISTRLRQKDAAGSGI